MKFPDQRRIIVILAIAILALTTIVKLFMLNHGFIGFDEAGVSFIAEKIASGEGSLYIDYFDHKPPFMHYLLAILFSLSDPSIFMVKLIAFLLDLFLIIVIFFVCTRLTNKTYALVAAAIYSTFNLSLSLNTEIPMTAFGLLAFYFYIKALNQENLANKFIFIAGVFIAISIWFKQSGVFFYIPIIAHLGYQKLKKQITWKSFFQASTMVTLGVLLISIPLLSYLMYETQGYFLNAILLFNIGLKSSSSRIFQLGKGLLILFSSFGFFLAITSSELFIRKQGLKKEQTALLFFSSLILLFILSSPEIFYQHFFQLIPFMTLLVVTFLAEESKKIKGIFMIILFIGIATVSLTNLESISRGLQKDPFQAEQEVLTYLGETIPNSSSFFSDNTIHTFLGGYNLTQPLVSITPAFTGGFDYKFICELDYLVLTHRQNFLSDQVKECIHTNFSLKNRFDNVGESFVEVWESNRLVSS